MEPHLAALVDSKFTLQFISKPSRAWPPEPLRWMGVTITRNALERADNNRGKRGLWLKLLDRLQMGFAY